MDHNQVGMIPLLSSVSAVSVLQAAWTFMSSMSFCETSSVMTGLTKECIWYTETFSTRSSTVPFNDVTIKYESLQVAESR